MYFDALFWCFLFLQSNNVDFTSDVMLHKFVQDLLIQAIDRITILIAYSSQTTIFF